MSAPKRTRRQPYRPPSLWHDPAILSRKIKLKGYRQVDFARLVGTTQTHICALLAGRRNASPPLMKRMAEILECKIEDLERKDDLAETRAAS